MEPMTMTIAAVVLSAVLLVGLALGAVYWIRSLRLSAMGELLEGLSGSPRLLSESANSFGRRSRGITQTRGNGCLALSDEELRFVQWVPRRTVTVPVVSIHNVETPKSHLGKTRGVRLLQVHWDHDGERDAIAFQVADLPRWIGELALVRKGVTAED